MKKVYLMKGMAVMALGLVVASCNKMDLTNNQQTISDEEVKANAEAALGVTIDPNQTWVMTKTVKANLGVNLGLDQQYTVIVYGENPLSNANATIFGRGTVEDGGTVNLDLTTPSGLESAFVGIFDSKNRRIVEQVAIEDNTINATIGGSTTRANRAAEADYTGTYAKSASDYLNDLTVSGMQQYTAINNETIDLYSGTLTNTIDGNGTGYFKVTTGFNPTDGQTANITADGVNVGTVKFYGTGNAAVADNFQSNNGFSACLNRSAIEVTPTVDCQLTVYSNDDYALMGWTDNGQAVTMWETAYTGNGTYFRGNPYLSDAKAGHTYKLWRPNTTFPFYGVKVYYEYHSKKLGDGRHFRVPSGTTITKAFSCNGNDASQQPMIDGSIVYVEGTLNLYGYDNNKNTLNSTSIVVGNGGKVILNGAVDMSNTGRIVVLPGGELTGANGSSLTVTNSAKCYNAGTINFAGELNTNGSDFYNNGTINVTTLRNTSGGKITNFGSIIAGNNTGAADAYNCEFINGCFWKYTGDAGIGQLTMLENSRLEIGGKAEFAQNFTTTDPDPAATHNVLMANSVIKVKDLYPTNTIFQGPTENGKVAIVQITGKLMVGRSEDINQWNNCYFDWDDSEIYNKNSVKQTLQNEDGEHGIYSGVHARITKFVKESASPYIIPAGKCTGDGYNPDGNTEETTPGANPIYSYAFEDTKKGDYDMNDVVIKAQETKDGKINLKLVAAGATLNLNIRLYPAPTSTPEGKAAVYSGEPTTLTYTRDGVECDEVHAMLGVAAGTMVNTGHAKADPITITIEKGSYDPAHLPLAIYSAAQGEMRLAASGEAPFGVIVPEDWKWPTEYVNIATAYNNVETSEGDQSFGTYANQSGKALNWFKYPTGSVMK